MRSALVRAAEWHIVMEGIKMKLKPIEKPVLKLLGLSSDYRTNKWQFNCTCGYSETLPTTRFSTETIACGHCGKEWFVNYNTLDIQKVNPK